MKGRVSRSMRRMEDGMPERGGFLPCKMRAGTPGAFLSVESRGKGPSPQHGLGTSQC